MSGAVWNMPVQAYLEMCEDLELRPDDRSYKVYGELVMGGVFAEVSCIPSSEMVEVRLFVNGFSGDESDNYAEAVDYVSIDPYDARASFSIFKRAVEKGIRRNRFVDVLGTLKAGCTDDWTAILNGANGTWV